MADPYDSSDEALFRLVDVDELDRLLAASGRPVRDSSKTVHLLKRVRKTLEADRDTIAGLHKHIGQMTDHLQRVGQATTLNPVDALKYLDDEQRELLFDRIARDRLSMLRSMIEQAERTREQLLGELEQVRSAAMSMAQRPDLPSDVRAEFTRLLAFLPSEVRPVHRPPLLDFPDPEPLPQAQAQALAHAQTVPEARTASTAGDPPANALADLVDVVDEVAVAPRPRSGRLPGQADMPTPGPPAPPSSGATLASVFDRDATSTSPDLPTAGAPRTDLPTDEAATPVFVDPWASPDTPVYVDPYAPATPATDSPPSYVDPYAPADSAPAFVDPWAGQSAATSAADPDDGHHDGHHDGEDGREHPGAPGGAPGSLGRLFD